MRSQSRFIVKLLLPLIVDKPLDSLVEKMCQRFEFCNSAEATAHNKHIAHYFSYFISQLCLSDSSFYKTFLMTEVHLLDLLQVQHCLCILSPSNSYNL
ncbi:unnamed protein product [Cylicocyclus nassatus]|uniref:Uncharacterized protein n=1 Tax=Cylicocyclus nassatus TaxID=53992 RepID=A0AA36HBS0_CYLNA|nr:unnamed protein product [Cylicocyclus nassatus]